tara:strand:+ start:991 stop:1239 length:249 start_codon:yes stop_codon:yes gene_type:complete
MNEQQRYETPEFLFRGEGYLSTAKSDPKTTEDGKEKEHDLYSIHLWVPAKPGFRPFARIDVCEEETLSILRNHWAESVRLPL